MPRKANRAGVSPVAGGPPALCVVNKALHRFPWPADPGQRCSIASPWLAIVNARGPWACWSHYRKDPAWLAVYRSLWGKPFWRAADNDLRVFTLALWQLAAAESYWGIVWGEPMRVAYELARLGGIDPATVSRGIPTLCEAGFACYLTHAEKVAAEDWHPARPAAKTGEGDSYSGGTRGGFNSQGEVQVQRETGRGTETGTATGDSGQRQPAGPQRAQNPGSNAGSTASDTTGTGTGTGTGRGTGTGTGPQGQRHPQGHAQGTAETHRGKEPASLPKSDRGSGHDPVRASARAGDGRSPAVPEAEPVGRIMANLHWQDPLAVEFGRRIFAAVKGREPPPDLFAASRDDRSVVGAFAAAFCQDFSKSLKPGQFDAFTERCCRDIAKKRGKAGVHNLGGVARAKIIPGILRTMAR